MENFVSQKFKDSSEQIANNIKLLEGSINENELLIQRMTSQMKVMKKTDYDGNSNYRLNDIITEYDEISLSNSPGDDNPTRRSQSG